jgi:protein-disulfide isomerase
MTRRRALLAATGATVIAGLAGCTGLGSGGDDTATDGRDPNGGEAGSDGGDTPSGPAATAPIPDDPGAQTYARTDAGATATVTLVTNWKCPFCAEFATGSDRVLSLGELVADYVAPGDVALACRALCYGADGEPFLGRDAPRAGRAGLAVWNVDPASYWRYHEHVLANQPPEDEAWATRERLVEFARGAGVSDPDAVGAAIGDGSYGSEVRATTAFAADAGVEGTPTLVVGDGTYSPFEPEALRDALDGVGG